jgi:hypothetical protein
MRDARCTRLPRPRAWPVEGEGEGAPCSTPPSATGMGVVPRHRTPGHGLVCAAPHPHACTTRSPRTCATATSAAGTQHQGQEEGRPAKCGGRTVRHRTTGHRRQPVTSD